MRSKIYFSPALAIAATIFYSCKKESNESWVEERTFNGIVMQNKVRIDNSFQSGNFYAIKEENNNHETVKYRSIGGLDSIYQEGFQYNGEFKESCVRYEKYSDNIPLDDHGCKLELLKVIWKEKANVIYPNNS